MRKSRIVALLVMGLVTLLLVTMLIRQNSKLGSPKPAWTVKATPGNASMSADSSLVYGHVFRELTVIDAASGKFKTLQLASIPEHSPTATTGSTIAYEADGAAHWLDLKSGAEEKEAAVSEGGNSKAAIVSTWGPNGQQLVRVLTEGAIVGNKTLEITDDNGQAVMKWQTEWEGPGDLVFHVPPARPVLDREIIVDFVDLSGPHEILVLEQDLQWGWKMKVKHRYPEMTDAFWCNTPQGKLLIGLPVGEMKGPGGLAVLAPDRYPRQLVERVLFVCSKGTKQEAAFDPPPPEGMFACGLSPGAGATCIVTFAKYDRHLGPLDQKHYWWCEVCLIQPGQPGTAPTIVRPSSPFVEGGGGNEWRPPRFTMSPDNKSLVLAERDQWSLYRWTDLAAKGE